MRDPKTARHRAVPPPTPRVGRLVRASRRRAGTAAVLTAMSVVGGVAFVRVTTAGAVTPPAIPATDFAYLKEAAKSCPALTPAKLAGQIMGPAREVKDTAIVAAVDRGDWDAWAPWPGASPADHRAKILALAHQTCDLVGQLRVLRVPGDPWRTAVAASHVGVGAVKAAGGVPTTATTYVQTVAQTAAWYAQQKQFGGPGPKPAATTTAAPKPTPTTPAPTATPTTAPATTAAPTTTPAPVPTTEAPTATATPLSAPRLPTTTPTTDAEASVISAPAYDPDVDYQITNPFAKRVLELPGDDTDTRVGTAVQIWTDQDAADQHWRIAPAGDGYVSIVNASSGRALSVRDGSTEDFAGVDQVSPDADDEGQQWQLRDAGDGAVWIVNRLSGKALDLFGDDLAAQDGQQVDLWSLQTYAKDQRWTITR